MPIYNAPLGQIDTAETRRYAGLARSNFDAAMIGRAADEAALLAAPRGSWQKYDYDSRRHLLLSDPPFPLEGASIQKHLAGCEAAITLAATIGEAIENQISQNFQNGHYAYAVLLDAAATAAVEQVADAMERAILPTAQREGYAMRWRFSPGYGDWPLAAQPSLLRLADAAAIGIRLTEALMLWPRKSITAIIGLSRKEENCPLSRSGAHDCSACGKADCPFRQPHGGQPG